MKSKKEINMKKKRKKVTDKNEKRRIKVSRNKTAKEKEREEIEEKVIFIKNRKSSSQSSSVQLSFILQFNACDFCLLLYLLNFRFIIFTNPLDIMKS